MTQRIRAHDLGPGGTVEPREIAFSSAFHQIYVGYGTTAVPLVPVRYWVGGVLYNYPDMVGYNGDIYRCRSTIAGTPPPDPTYWDKLTGVGSGSGSGGGAGGPDWMMATEEEALEGVSNDVVMSPLRVDQAVDQAVAALPPLPFATDPQAVAGTATDVVMSPHAVMAWYVPLLIPMNKVSGLEAALSTLAGGQVGGSFAYSTKALMDADLAHVAGTTATVFADTQTNNGSYVKNGASGAGNWSRYSAETVVTLDARTAVIKTNANAGFSVTDPSGAALMWVTPTTLSHPQINAMASQVASNATLLSAFRNLSGVDGVSFTDPLGNALLAFSPTAFNHPVINVMQAALTDLLPGKGLIKTPSIPVGFAVTDPVGNALFQVTPDTFRHPVIDALVAGGGGGGGTGQADWSAIAATAEHIHLVFDGQSNSVGVGAGPIQTTTPLIYADRFPGGVRPQDGGTDPAVIFGPLVPLVETIFNGQYETQAGGACRMIKQLLLAEDGIDLGASGQRLLCSCPGEGGTTVLELSNTPFIERLNDGITYGYSRTTGFTGKSYAVNAIAFNQGNSDYQAGTNRALYLEQIKGLQKLAQDKYKAVTGVTRNIPFFTIQTCSHLTYLKVQPDVALAQLDLQKEKYGCMVAPDYLIGMNTPKGWQSDDVHTIGPSSIHLGAYFGFAMKRWLWDGIKVEPLRPITAERFGTTVILKYKPVGKLAIDITRNPDPGNYGFTAVDAAGVAVTVTSVSLVSDDQVAVRTVTALPKNGEIRMGWIGDGKHGLTNLRDSQGDTVIFEPGGLAKPLHRWQPIDQIILP